MGIWNSSERRKFKLHVSLQVLSSLVHTLCCTLSLRAAVGGKSVNKVIYDAIEFSRTLLVENFIVGHVPMDPD
jgi:hypothetical protein